MESEQAQAPPPSTANAAATSWCRKKKSEGACFVRNLRDHVDEFIHASMDEHKACFKETIQKTFCTSKVASGKASSSGAAAAAAGEGA